MDHITAQSFSSFSFSLGVAVPSTQPGSACSMDSLDSDTLSDLHRQLDSGLDRIIKRYSCYVSCVRESLRTNGISANVLCSDLLTVSAFSNTEQKRTLLSTHKTELEKAVDLYAVFNLLVTEYASFLNCDIFEYILDKYQLRTGQEELNYPEYLDAYIRKLKISEFIKINPLLKKFTATSKELVLKIDIEATSRLSKILHLKNTIASILGVNNAALQLVDIKEGCVLVSFLIPTAVAEVTFNEHTVFTQEQTELLQTAQVSWLKWEAMSYSVHCQERIGGRTEIGRVFNTTKLDVPIKCTSKAVPTVTVEVLPRASQQSRVLLIVHASLLVPSKCSKHKWLVQCADSVLRLTCSLKREGQDAAIRTVRAEERITSSPGAALADHVTSLTVEVNSHDQLRYDRAEFFTLHVQAEVVVYGSWSATRQPGEYKMVELEEEALEIVKVGSADFPTQQ